MIASATAESKRKLAYPAALNRFRRKRFYINFASAVALLIMGMDLHETHWGCPAFWFVAYLIPAVLLIIFSFKQSLVVFNGVVSSIMGVAVLRGVATFSSEGHFYYLANNALMFITAYTSYIYLGHLMRSEVRE